ncbi:MAG: Gfo/Idh/MocA family oxidoreductase [Kiritimatiellaeota bacterium]|nr:Gfo/Idh/MocA family oxidoreductase [Kiritimatiellota bacterium]
MADPVSTKMEGKTSYKGKKLRVAIIGCGGIAQAHLATYKKFLPEVEIVAGVDIIQDRLDVMNETWGVPKDALFIDDGKGAGWRAMIKKIKPDAVDVCTPNGIHSQPVIDACNAGCHAIVEKPMAMTVAECEKMVAAAEKNKVKLSVGFQQRYRDVSAALVKARDNGVFGDIFFVEVDALRRRGIPNWGVFGQKKLQGGGPLIDIGVHMLEAAYEFMGCPKPVAASANIWTYMGDKPSTVLSSWPGWDWKTYTVEDYAAGQIRFDNGAILQIRSSFAAHIKEGKENWKAVGTKGGCSWENAEIFTDYNDLMVNTTPAFIGSNDWETIFKRKLQNWVSGCMKGTELDASGYDGLAVQKMLCGLYASAAAGKEVPIK